ncbi:hypothetical protein MIND_00878200 [Mycena indigotica]|uniref:SH3 domain-containing protein n=1 Tax=Mycena indigotica TaxID=2126181 RepID=A0A8H6SGT5_9AGAR|nr:uncharacterized protein MIND_00878200 [Mycena indigotica]KAF7299293.1 hypothetical protein MIND_00878200 [Mycena indigotica]
MHHGYDEEASYSDEGEHSMLEDEDEDEFMDDEDDTSILSVPDESIDFSLVYSLHSFSATVEGQANVVKGDSLFLLDDSNSYWWLIRVLKTQEVGYIPAENIETPVERLARLNKHKNVDLASATQAELQSDLASSRPANTQSNAPRVGNTVRDPLNQRQSLAFSASLHVHRYPPAVWDEERWFAEREAHRMANMTESDDEYDPMDLEDEDHEEGEWEVGSFEAEDRELAIETMSIMEGATTEKPAAEAEPETETEIPLDDAPASPPQVTGTVSPIEAQAQPSSLNAERQSIDTDGDRRRPRESSDSDLIPRQSQDSEPQSHTPLASTAAAPVRGEKSSSAASGKLRKEQPSNNDEGKKKSRGVFSIFSGRNTKEKSNNSPPLKGGMSSQNQQQQQQQTSEPRNNDAAALQAATSQLRQREQQQHALYTQQYLARSASQTSKPELSPGLDNATLSPPATRSRPGSLIPSVGDGVPGLSVVRIFAGQNLPTEATFKTVLLNSSTTSSELIKQAAQRFRLDDLDPDAYNLSIKRAVESADMMLRPDETPLVIFEGLVEKVHRVTQRASIASMGSMASVLSNDFTDDSAVRFYLSRKVDAPVEDNAPPTPTNVRHSISTALDEIALAKLRRTSVDMSANGKVDMDAARQEIIAAQRKATRENQRALISGSVGSMAEVVQSDERAGEDSPRSVTPNSARLPTATTTTTTAPKRVFLPSDDFGVANMITVIQLRASQNVPRQPPVQEDPVDDMLFGRRLDLDTLHPKIRAVYAETFRTWDETDKYLDDFLLKSLSQTGRVY